MSSIQMVDLQRQYQAIKAEVDKAIQNVIESSSFIKGPAVETFEQELSKYLQGGRALGVGSGTDALQIALMALGIGAGDEIITTPFTFVATAEAAALLQAKPVFVDINPRTFNLDVAQVEEHITQRTKAILPVHLFGQPAEMDKILELANQHDLYVIEDCAQSIGSTYNDRMAGRIGDIGCFSFFPSKNLGAFGDGGALVTNDEELFERIKKIANHGSAKKYHNERVGVNSRLDAIQAAVLRVKLQYLDEYTKARQTAAQRYDQLLADLPNIVLPFRAPTRSHVFHQYTVRVTSSGRKNRDRLAKHLTTEQIPHAVYYPKPLHHLPVFKKLTDQQPSLPVAETVSQEVLSLPMHTELTADQQAAVAESIERFMQNP